MRTWEYPPPKGMVERWIRFGEEMRKLTGMRGVALVKMKSGGYKVLSLVSAKLMENAGTGEILFTGRSKREVKEKAREMGIRLGEIKTPSSAEAYKESIRTYCEWLNREIKEASIHRPIVASIFSHKHYN